MRQIPSGIMESNEHGKVLEFISRRFADPGQLRAEAEQIYASWPTGSCHLLRLVDGRVFERLSRTRILELLNQTGITLASKLDLQALLQSGTDAAT